jgi:hypothetical protein
MAYRGDDARDALEAPTADGLLKVVLGPNRVDLSVGPHSLHIAERVATLVEHKKQRQERRASIKLTGNLVVARGFPREAIGLWIASRDPAGGDALLAGSMQRIFGVEPVSLLDLEGLGALGRLDTVAQRLRAHLTELSGTARRAIEIGSGHALDKVLLVDHGDHYIIYARRLFRDRARFALAVHDDGRVVVPDGKRAREVRVAAQFGVTVRGDYVRFADQHHVEVAKVALPWLGPEDRDEVARRIAALVAR